MAWALLGKVAEDLAPVPAADDEEASVRWRLAC